VERILRSKLRKVVTGVAYVTDKSHYEFFDQERRTLQEKLEKLLPGPEVAVAGMSKDETKVLVVTYTDRTGDLLLLRSRHREAHQARRHQPWINEADMAPMKPVQYTSRDGLTIHGYLTVPVGVEPKNCRSS